MGESCEVRCMYCKQLFVPVPVRAGNGKKQTVYVECPICGNGVERHIGWRDRVESKSKRRAV